TERGAFSTELGAFGTKRGTNWSLPRDWFSPLPRGAAGPGKALKGGPRRSSMSALLSHPKPSAAKHLLRQKTQNRARRSSWRGDWEMSASPLSPRQPAKTAAPDRRDCPATWNDRKEKARR